MACHVTEANPTVTTTFRMLEQPPVIPILGRTRSVPEALASWKEPTTNKRHNQHVAPEQQNVHRNTLV